MSRLHISAQVRHAIGNRNTDLLDAGVGLPADSQCWVCGGVLNLLAARPGEVALSVLAFEHESGGVATITCWSHRWKCSRSRIVSLAEFEASAARDVPSPVVEEPMRLLIDGHETPWEGH